MKIHFNKIMNKQYLGNNFDALSCESCKAFFRRNAIKTNVINKTNYRNIRHCMTCNTGSYPVKGCNDI